MPKQKKKRKSIKESLQVGDNDYLFKEESVKKIAIKFFGRFSDKYTEYFLPLKDSLSKADMKILFRTYLSMMFFSMFLTFIVTFVITLISSIVFNFTPLFAIFGLIILPLLFSSITLFLVYSYPVSVTESRKRDIDSNLPFALTHMSAIAQSGAPPLTIFKILSKFDEYGEISKEAEKINRDVESFGLDILNALENRMDKTPSSDFRELLQGISSTIQGGGNLKIFLIERSKQSMFEYTITKEKYNELLTVYADLYTSLLLAAPTIFIIVLSMLSVLGGNILNLTIEQIMNLGILSLTFLNMLFLSFIHITQPKL